MIKSDAKSLQLQENNKDGSKKALTNIDDKE